MVALHTCMALQLASLPECSKLRTSEMGAKWSKFAASMHAIHAAAKLVKPSLGVLVSSHVLQHIPAHSCTPASTLLHVLTHSGSSILTHPCECPELPAALHELDANTTCDACSQGHCLLLLYLPVYEWTVKAPVQFCLLYLQPKSGLRNWQAVEPHPT